MDENISQKMYAEHKTMNGQQSNPSFVPDDLGSFAPITEKNIYKQKQAPVYVVELQDTKKTPKQTEDYDPYVNRQHVSHPTSNVETLLHLLKGSLGTGILAMPKAFHNSGYVVGIVGTVLIGLLCTYCIHLLIRAQYELCRRKKIPSMTYTQTAEAAMLEGPPLFRKTSNYMVHIVNAFILIYQLGICCVYVVFVSANIKAVVDEYTEHISVRYYMLMILIPLILINWVRKLKFLAPLSTLANAITVVTFGIILYYIFREPISFENREMVGELDHFPLFFGTVLFALEAIGVIMPLENEMETPQSFGGPCGVLNQGMFTIIILYVGMGFFGYLKYGAEAEGSITLNLGHTEMLAQSVKLLLAFAIFITHALQCYVAVDITWNDYIKQHIKNKEHNKFYEYAWRTVLVLITFLLAVAIPNLELFISLFGALCLSALGLAIPALIESSLWWYHISGCEFYFMCLKNTFFVIFGICGLVVGTYTSLRDIIHEFS
ncbi:proton-coupled amino acid transporter-like protein CG1139 [Chrysoperla carnea]|uniref:proton-coupled amino acid transporter-like protein CG1139 n=1 Tax=Chrysoperla carnea TaxID=189513 RepID=UPI001D09017F|nr:proton-coupled amino acid transporter-like protein CG1139 [Chrysoperla carnea]XP_044734184.1 proton-coupled amino acid transporter-like protein CG1139 [Chrysoperla carnea]XP_044734185.1 proton-coupled amino acid transporter-like protein CG1139 [Chrysoperla carnea]